MVLMPWTGSDHGFAPVRRVGLLQFAFTEGLDGAKQGGTAPSRSVRQGGLGWSRGAVRDGRSRWRSCVQKEKKPDEKLFSSESDPTNPEQLEPGPTKRACMKGNKSKHASES